MKKIISTLLVVACLLGMLVSMPLTSSASVTKNVFSDVTSGSWYEESVTYAFEHGYVSGTADAIFSPGAKMTRATICLILANVDGANLSSFEYNNSFKDVARGKWYHNAVEWAYYMGITSGVGSGLFSPNAELTRQDMVMLMYKYAQIKGKSVSAYTDISYYSDYSKVSSYARTAFSWAVATGLVNGTSATTLSPKSSATRAQFSVIIKSFDDKKFGHRWGATNVITNAARTCTSNGSYTYTCKDCGVKRTVTLPAWHTFAKGECSSYDAGYCTLVAKCRNCSQTKKDTAKHNFVYGMCTRCNNPIITMHSWKTGYANDTSGTDVYLYCYDDGTYSIMYVNSDSSSAIDTGTWEYVPNGTNGYITCHFLLTPDYPYYGVGRLEYKTSSFVAAGNKYPAGLYVEYEPWYYTGAGISGYVKDVLWTID